MSTPGLSGFARPAANRDMHLIFLESAFLIRPCNSCAFPRSQHTAVRLPLLQVLLSINRRARLVVIPGLGDLLDALRDERRQL